MDNKKEKQKLIDEIKALIDQNSTKTTDINLKYIEYFELDELFDIRDSLLLKKEKSYQDLDYLEEIFNKCS